MTTTPDWLTQAYTELDRLQPPHVTKKRATIIALVDARLSGKPEESVFRDRSDTCSRTVYHEKWKKDALFASVLENVTKLARDWKDGEAMRALAEAARMMALASPGAVKRAIEVMLYSRDDQAVLRAAFGILDRAGVETAAKSSAEVTGKGGEAIETRIEIVYADTEE